MYRLTNTIVAEEDEELAKLRRLARDIVSNEATEPMVANWEREHTFPYDLMQQLANAGLFGLLVEPADGGLGLGASALAVVSEELARPSYDVASAYGITVFCLQSVARHANEPVRTEMISQTLSGDNRFAFALTEPDSGSDAAALRSVATRNPDGWKIRGEKIFCSGANRDDTTLLVACKTNDGTVSDSDGDISLFLIPHNRDGLELREMSTVGRHMLGTWSVAMDDVFVPDGHLVGERGTGWDVIRDSLLWERVFTSAAYAGTARGAFDIALEYATQREQFDKRIGDFQAISHMLADMFTRTSAARLLAYQAARLVEERMEDALLAVSMAKLFGSETLVEVTNHAMQIFGGHGYTTEFPIERYWRDARVTTISAGSSQIQRNLIARKLGLEPIF